MQFPLRGFKCRSGLIYGRGVAWGWCGDMWMIKTRCMLRSTYGKVGKGGV